MGRCAPSVLRSLGYGVELNQEFAHAGHHGHFGWLAGLTQVLIEISNRRVETKTCDDRHVQKSTQVCPAAPDITSSSGLPAAVVEGSDSNQGCDLFSY